MKENSPETLSRLIISIPKAEAELVFAYLRIQKGQKKECEILEKLYRKNILPATGFSELPTIELSFREVRNLVRLWVEAIRQVSPDPGQQALRHLADAQIYYSADLPGRCLACVDAGIEIASSVDAFHLLGELIQLGKKVSFYTAKGEKEAQVFAHYTTLEKNNQAALQQYSDLLKIAEDFYYPMVHLKRNTGEIDFKMAERAILAVRKFEGNEITKKARFWVLFLLSYFLKATPDFEQFEKYGIQLIQLCEENNWIQQERPDFLSREIFNIAILNIEIGNQKRASKCLELLKSISLKPGFSQGRHFCRKIIVSIFYYQHFGKVSNIKSIEAELEEFDNKLPNEDLQAEVERIYFMLVRAFVSMKAPDEVEKWIKKLIYIGRKVVSLRFQTNGRVLHLMSLYQQGDLAKMAISADNYLRYAIRKKGIDNVEGLKNTFILFKKLSNAITLLEKREIFQEYLNNNPQEDLAPTFKLLDLKTWIGNQINQNL